MAAGNGKSVEGFSTMIVYILAAILISMSRSISCCSHETREQVNENALSADDRRILKLMMDRCVDLYLDPFSSLAENLLEDELIRLKKLNTYRCGKFYNLISWSSTYIVKARKDSVVVLMWLHFIRWGVVVHHVGLACFRWEENSDSCFCPLGGEVQFLFFVRETKMKTS